MSCEHVCKLESFPPLFLLPSHRLCAARHDKHLKSESSVFRFWHLRLLIRCVYTCANPYITILTWLKELTLDSSSIFSFSSPCTFFSMCDSWNTNLKVLTAQLKKRPKHPTSFKHPLHFYLLHFSLQFPLELVSLFSNPMENLLELSCMCLFIKELLFNAFKTLKLFHQLVLLKMDENPSLCSGHLQGF